MQTLLLMRHAKSSWASPDQDDFDRPLNKRGSKAAPVMAAHMADKGWHPDLVICSAAVRTRATLTLALPEMDHPTPKISYDDALYLATPAEIQRRLRANARDEQTVMMIGHNPGLHAFALALCGHGRRRAMRALAMKFPTAALAVITLPEAGWENLPPASGRLEAFISPRELA